MDQPQPLHTNLRYEEELRGLRATLLKMGGLVERQIAEAIRSESTRLNSSHVVTSRMPSSA